MSEEWTPLFSSAGGTKNLTRGAWSGQQPPFCWARKGRAPECRGNAAHQSDVSEAEMKVHEGSRLAR